MPFTVFPMSYGACVALVAFLVVLPSVVSGGYYRSAVGPGGPSSPGPARPGPLTLNVVQCLAHCFTQLNINPTSDTNCPLNPLCKTCAHVCDQLQTRPATWRPACKRHSCNKGCQTACNHNFNRDPHHTNTNWAFPVQPSLTMIDRTTGVIRWCRPRPLDDIGASLTSRQVKVVYVIVHGAEGHWIPVKWTVTTHARLQVAPYENSPHFRLLAVTPEGVAANVALPDVDEQNAGIDAASGDEQDDNADDESSAEVPDWHDSRKFVSKLPGVFSSVQVHPRSTASGHVNAMITWSQRMTANRATYTVMWSMTSCNVNTTVPHCPLAPATRTMQITTGKEKTVEVVVKDLILNADYVIDVGLTSGPTEHVTLVTPPCHRPDATWRRCAETSRNGRAQHTHHVTSSDTSPDGDLQFETAVEDGSRGDSQGESSQGESSRGEGNRDKGSQRKGSQGNVSKSSARGRRVMVTATLATLIGVITICVTVGTYVICKHWNKNKHAAVMRSAPYGLWTPTTSLSSNSTVTTPGSYCPIPKHLTSDTHLLQDPSSSLPSLKVSPVFGAVDVQPSRSTWFHLSERGDLQHMTLTPGGASSRAHSTPQEYLQWTQSSRAWPKRLRMPSTGPISLPSQPTGQGDDNVSQVPPGSTTDVEFDSRQTWELFQGHHPRSKSLETTDTESTCSQHTPDDHTPHSSQDHPGAYPDLKLIDPDLDQSVLSGCTYTSTSLHLSVVAPDCLSEDGYCDDTFCNSSTSSDDLTYSSPTRFKSNSVQEVTYRFCSPIPEQEEEGEEEELELTPFLLGASEGATEVAEDSDSLNEHVRAVLDCSQDSFSFYHSHDSIIV